METLDMQAIVNLALDMDLSDKERGEKLTKMVSDAIEAIEVEEISQAKERAKQRLLGLVSGRKSAGGARRARGPNITADQVTEGGNKIAEWLKGNPGNHSGDSIKHGLGWTGDDSKNIWNKSREWALGQGLVTKHGDKGPNVTYSASQKRIVGKVSRAKS